MTAVLRPSLLMPKTADGQHGGAKARRGGGGIRHRVTRFTGTAGRIRIRCAKNTRITSATIDRHERRSSRRTDGPSSFTACSALGARRAAADRRSGRSSRWPARRRRARRPRAPPPARGAGRARCAPAGRRAGRHSDCSVAGRQRARVGARGADDLVAQRQQLAQHRRRRPCRRGSRCRPPARRPSRKPRSASASAAMPPRVVRAVEDGVRLARRRPRSGRARASRPPRRARRPRPARRGRPRAAARASAKLRRW